MYIGGAQKRPDGNYSRPVLDPKGEVIGQVAEGNRKDIRDAVEAAHKAAPGWVICGSNALNFLLKVLSWWTSW